MKQYNQNKQLLVVGCNYHTTWQSNKAMHFVLSELKDNKAKLTTRTTIKSFWVDINDLIFIDSGYNKQKACDLLGLKYKELFD